MAKKVDFLKGSSLAAYARKKAAGLGLDSRGKKLDDLVWMIQKKEGHDSCFKKEKSCSHTSCCWQASCGATIK
ncbi:MAG: hypothetical protein K9K37_03175 [Desulfocapsa sp.]|nr:hypothetical protein [Desulfocapsa sp.]